MNKIFKYFDFLPQKSFYEISITLKLKLDNESYRPIPLNCVNENI